MSRLLAFVLTFILAFGLLVVPSLAELIGGVDFPNGAVSFADAVVEFSPVVINGQPIDILLVPENTLGVPDYNPGVPCEDGGSCTFVSLGSGGSITLQFLDNVLTGSGDAEYDLWVFEIGGLLEDTFVEISVDGAVWHPVGKTFGSTYGIDIDAFGFAPSDRFRYVRLTDDVEEGGQDGDAAGADIDAVGAISSELDCTILSTSPPFPWSVGDAITITGSGFLEGSVPLINGVEAAPFALVSDTEIQATVPALADGQYDLWVSMPGQIDCQLGQAVVAKEDLSWGNVKSIFR